MWTSDPFHVCQESGSNLENLHLEHRFPTTAQENQGGNIFIDMSGSKSRTEKANRPECCANATTCITPGHQIYSTQLQRFVRPDEMLGLQCVWKVDAKNQDAFTEMANSSLAQDLAGNGMTGSVAQAVVLTALSTIDAFLNIDRSDCLASAPVAPQVNPVAQATPVAPAAAAARPDLVQPEPLPPPAASQTAEEVPEPKRRGRPPKRKMPETHELVPARRIRGKQPVKPDGLLQVAPRKRQRGVGAGNSKATGKSKSCTIFDKEMICQAYDKLKKEGCKNPDKELQKMKLTGYYRGCYMESKWGKVRREQCWTILVESAPRLCKSKKELPNSLRHIINFPRLKHGKHPQNTEKKTILPPVLKQVVEEAVMERIDTGEEVTMNYVKHTILWLAQLWNECVGAIRQQIQMKNIDMLRTEDERLAGMSDAELESLFSSLTKRADEVLVPITLVSSDDALRNFVKRWDGDVLSVVAPSYPCGSIFILYYHLLSTYIYILYI